MRYQVIVPQEKVFAPAGASVHVYVPGTTTHTALTLFADATSATTLANPYTHPGGKVVFYLSSSAQVQVGVQPSGAPAPAIADPVTPAGRSYSYAVRLAAGRPVDWNVH